MIICTNCNYRNEDDDEFCGSCGRLLEWVGERVEAPAEPPVEAPPAPAPEPARAGLVTRVKAAVGLEGPATGAAAPGPGGDVAADTSAAEAEAEQQARRAAEAEQAARAAAVEEEARRAAADAEAARAAAVEEEARRAAADAEAAGARPDAEEARRAAGAEEARRAAAEEDAGRRAAAEEAARRAAEEEEEEARRAAEEEEARRAAMARLLARPQQRPAPTPPATPGPPPPSRPRVAPGPAPAEPVRPAPEEPARPAPEPVRAYEPAEVRAQPARPVAPPTDDERGIRPGDLVCGQCGRGNDPTRKFCRKCGASLLEAQVAKPPPWWKRLFQRRKKVYRAGERPGRSTRGAVQGARGGGASVTLGLRRVLLLLAGLGIVVPLAIPSTRRVVLDAFTSARKTVLPRYENVQPVKVEATSSTPGHDPFLMVDRTRNTHWAEGAPGEGVGEVVTFEFDGRVDLDKVVIRSGAFDSNDPAAFESQPRPAAVRFVLDETQAADFTLRNDPEDQVLTLKARQVARVQLILLDVHRSAGGSDTSISQVEFQEKT